MDYLRATTAPPATMPPPHASLTPSVLLLTCCHSHARCGSTGCQSQPGLLCHQARAQGLWQCQSGSQVASQLPSSSKNRFEKGAGWVAAGAASRWGAGAARLLQEAELCPLPVEGGTDRAIKIDLLPACKEESTCLNT